jgi:ribonuclease-3
MPEQPKRSRRKAGRPRGAPKPTSAARARPSPRAGDARRLAARIGFEPRRPTLLHRALTHRSAQQELDLPSNERLEFLGDAVLGLTVAAYFYRTHPDLPEGDLTKFKAVAVSESVLAEVARKLGLGRYLILSRGEEQSGGRDRTSILADALEAIFGAIYLDRGATAARKVILRLLGDHFCAIERYEHEPDYKTLLQEKIQESHRSPPTYRMVQESGPDHDRTFVAEVRIGNRVLGRGLGKSKKQAEQAAASEAFRRYEEE